MDRLIIESDSPNDLDTSNQNLNRFNNLYKNNDQLNKKQQQRRNEILLNRLSKKDQLIAGIRGLVTQLAEDSSGESNGEGEDLDEDDQNCIMLGSNNNNTNHHHNVQNYQFSQNVPMTSPSTHKSTSPTKLEDHNAIANNNTNNNNKPGKTNQVKKFRNKAMLSEWLLERPMNFETEWLLKPTPVGRRCLVFARKGETVAYSRTGQFIKAFQSNLPGGNRYQSTHCRRQFSIVDCIYINHKNAFYLMDALAWNDQKLYESEASFRFFWLQSKYNENKDKLLAVNTRNESRFFCLNTYSTSDQDILTALNNDTLIKEHNLHLDGLLFFHVSGPYVPGANPLVLWIKPEMASRVLNLPPS